MADNDNNSDANLFGGSVDRSKLEEMKAAAGDDPGRQAQVAEVQAQVDAVAESDAAAEKARQEALGQRVDLEPESEEPAEVPTAGVTAEPASQPEDLSGLTKAELVERAEAAGIATEGKTKAELVADLEAGSA